MSDAAQSSSSDDPYAWLEDVTAERSMDWVKVCNAKIPGVEKIGDYFYNFWKDKQLERGLWRRTTLAQ